VQWGIAPNKEIEAWGEHDFIAVKHDGEPSMERSISNVEHHSEDPADPEKTCRVLTIMLAEEYWNEVAPLRAPHAIAGLLFRWMHKKRARPVLHVFPGFRSCITVWAEVLLARTGKVIARQDQR
jgi:Protein of unknown function (DUF3768)